MIKMMVMQLFKEDRIGLPEDIGVLFFDFPLNPDTQTGSRERVTKDHAFG